jgi:hypothetical protein
MVDNTTVGHTVFMARSSMFGKPKIKWFRVLKVGEDELIIERYICPIRSEKLKVKKEWVYATLEEAKLNQHKTMLIEKEIKKM